MKEKSRQNGRRMPEEDASEFGVVRIISRPAPDAEDRLRRLFTLLLEHAARERQARVREAFPPRRGSRWRRHRGGSLMQPESFPTDDSLGRSVPPASAPLPAKRRAHSARSNAPLPDRLRRRVEDHRRGQGIGSPLGERRHDRRVLAHRTPHRRIRAVGRGAGPSTEPHSSRDWRRT